MKNAKFEFEFGNTESYLTNGTFIEVLDDGTKVWEVGGRFSPGGPIIEESEEFIDESEDTI